MPQYLIVDSNHNIPGPFVYSESPLHVGEIIHVDSGGSFLRCVYVCRVDKIHRKPGVRQVVLSCLTTVNT